LGPRYPFNDVDLRDLNNSRTQQIILVGEGKKVLEIGPASGSVTKALREHGCHVTCIEIDPEAARLARKYANRTIRGDIEAIELRKATRGEKYDVILLGDVLEHVKEPKRVLERLRPCLKRSGYVVATVPNVAHGSVRLLLLDGNFDLQPSGILDSTHLHFFTRKTFLELFASSGYVVEEFRTITVPIDSAENLALDLAKYPQELVESILSDPEAMVHQFALVAKPGKPRMRSQKGRRLPVSRRLGPTAGSDTDPLSTLLRIYWLRQDLQRAYPEVRKGNYLRLVEWASLTRDGSRPILRPYRSWYATNPLSKQAHVTKERLEGRVIELEKLNEGSQASMQEKDAKIRELQDRLNTIENSGTRKLVKRISGGW
jgi:2-polyprenyl-3-methyl-5-hydroxy-6-metoxy-1,4-benzoquinol methylase